MTPNQFPNIDFLEASRKFKLYSDDIDLKLPRSREDRDKELIEIKAFTKELTLFCSQIFHGMHFLKDRIEAHQYIMTLEDYKEYMKTLIELKEMVQSQISIRSEENAR